MRKIIPQNIKNIYHLIQAVIANVIYGFPSKKIKVIGVTGTNGKTTTCQMIASILEESGKKVALASTINFKIGSEEWTNATKYTTLSPFYTQKFIKRAVDNKCDYLVVETSSHSLHQFRVWGVEYYIAAVTNVTREHLDYHKTMEEYRKSKLRLMKKAKIAIVNLDMENPEEFLRYNNEKKMTYSLKNPSADIFADEIVSDIEGSRFKVNGEKFSLNLPTDFNIENALAAIGVASALGINMSVAAKGLAKISNVPGRLERVANNRGLNIIVDYAVTPDSLEKLYTFVSKLKQEDAKAISVFGACGERDRGKRPMMGKIVSKFADIIILTDEDPYHENPMQIITEVKSGIKDKEDGKNMFVIMDRREAIKKALSIAVGNDIVVVTGKGAEETMAIGDKRIPWSDKAVILEELQKLS